MNQIRFTCSNNHPFKVPAKFAGKRAKCPKCGEVVTIPQVSTLNTTSKIIPSNDDLEKSRSTGELSPLAASVANSYTQNPIATPQSTDAQLNNEQPNTDVPGWVFWAIVIPFGGLIGVVSLMFAFNASGIATVMGGYILVMGAFLFIKPQVSASMFVAGFVLSIATYFWPTSAEKAEANSLAVTKTLDDNSASPNSNQHAAQPAKQSGNGVVHLATATQPTKINRDPVGEEVTIQQIEIFGRDWIGKKVRISNVFFNKLSNSQDDFALVKMVKDGATSIKNNGLINAYGREKAQENYKLLKSLYVTFVFGGPQRGRGHNICWKRKWGDLLSRLKKYDEIVVEGEIVELEEDYYDSNSVGIEVTHIELVEAYQSQ